MDFARPNWFWLLLSLFPLTICLAAAHRRRLALWNQLGQGGGPRSDGWISGLIAISLLIVAIAEPRWGRDRAQTIPPGRDVVLLVDVSRSMAVEDAIPSRLGVAIEAATSLISAMAKEPGDRAAVVAFAGVGVVRCGLTENLGAVNDVLARLRPGAVQPSGTDLAAALDVALATFDDHDHDDGRMIVIFTDGEDHGGTWSSRLKTLHDRQIIVNAVAIGDPESPQPVPGDGPTGVHFFDGNPVASRREDSALEALAAATDGVVVKLGLMSTDLGSLYRDKIALAARNVREGRLPPDRAHRYAIFIMTALAVVLLRGRFRLTSGHRYRAGVVTTLVLSLMMGGAEPSDRSPRSLIDRGQLAYKAGDYPSALQLFQEAAVLAPRLGVAHFNLAATLFAQGNYPQAIELYQQAAAFGDPTLKLKADFGMGNAFLMLDDAENAIAHYDRCLASPGRSSQLDATRNDARVNREYALKRRRDRDQPQEKSEPKMEASAKKPKAQPENPTSKQTPGDTPNPAGNSSNLASNDEQNPAEQLDRAIENVKQVLKNRPPDPTPPLVRPIRKDW